MGEEAGHEDHADRGDEAGGAAVPAGGGPADEQDGQCETKRGGDASAGDGDGVGGDIRGQEGPREFVSKADEEASEWWMIRVVSIGSEDLTDAVHVQQAESVLLHGADVIDAHLHVERFVEREAGAFAQFGHGTT